MSTQACHPGFSAWPAVIVVLVLLLLPSRLRAAPAEWQWSVPVESATSSETGGHPRAFLWIPPDCQFVRGVVVGQHNMEEEPILEHPKLRAALTELGLAAVWITPPLDLWFRFDRGAGEHFEAMMTKLAQESGYDELAFAPIVPIGHSAAASYPWNFAAWNLQRTLAAISVSGQWPYWQHADQPDWGGRSIDGIPGLVTMGEYESADSRAVEGLKQRQQHPQLPLSMVAEPGGGHFDVSEAKVDFLALYLRKACQYRLPTGTPTNRTVALKPINPAQQGWLVDRWRLNRPPRAPAAPVGQFTGDPAQAFWCFDAEHARATEAFGARYRSQQAALLGYEVNGQIVSQVNGTHQQVTLPFRPLDDGLTFKLSGTFLDAVPAGRPESWTGLKAGSPVSHPRGGGPIVIERVCGPVEKLGDDTFALRFYRMGMDNPKRTPEIWLTVTHPGDDQFKRSVQQALLRIPFRNPVGADQRITFPEIRDQIAGTKSLPLKATSDAGMPVHYFVREGPAVIAGDTLHFTALPPRTKFPVQVTVVAWQYGRASEPKLKTAAPVERSFRLVK